MELKLGPLEGALLVLVPQELGGASPGVWNPGSEESLCQLVTCHRQGTIRGHWGTERVVLGVLEKPPAGANYFPPGQDTNRKEPVSFLPGLVASLLALLVEPHREPGARGEMQPRQHKANYKRMGLNLTDTVLTTSILSSQSSPGRVY